MGNSTVTFDAVNKCSINDFDKVQTAAMKATAPTDHQYVPWVLVDGELLDNDDLLLKSICDAYDGPTPPSCKRFVGANPSRCPKEW